MWWLKVSWCFSLWSPISIFLSVTLSSLLVFAFVRYLISLPPSLLWAEAEQTKLIHYFLIQLALCCLEQPVSAHLAPRANHSWIWTNSSVPHILVEASKAELKTWHRYFSNSNNLSANAGIALRVFLPLLSVISISQSLFSGHLCLHHYPHRYYLKLRLFTTFFSF